MPYSLLLYLANVLCLVISYYCWDVVYSVYRDLKVEEVEGTDLPMKITIPCISISITCGVKSNKTNEGDQCRCNS